MHSPKHFPAVSGTVRQTKSVWPVRRILLLLLVAVVLSFFLMPNPWCKFIAIQTTLSLLALQAAIPSFKPTKYRENRMDVNKW